MRVLALDRVSDFGDDQASAGMKFFTAASEWSRGTAIGRSL